MPSEHSSQDPRATGVPDDLAASSRARSPGAPAAAVTRRAFIATGGLAALGLVAGCALPGARSSFRAPSGSAASDTSTAAVVTTESASIGPGWKPLASLSAVAVAADAGATSYAKLDDAEAFDAHPATRLLERALTGASGQDPIEFLRTLVAVGGTVLVKPNWVEPASWADGKITHPSLVVGVARLAADAVGPTGRVIIGEGTSEGHDLPRILSATGFRAALKALAPSSPQRAPIDIVDLNARSAGRLRVALGRRSRFSASNGVVYDAHGKSMGSMGDGRVGTYLLARPVIEADLIIDMAKAKVHCSAGVTLALKNLVGIVPSDDGPYGDNSMKDIPHYSAGDVESGTRYVGNRTIGRSAADLHALATYVARDGSLQKTPQRNLLCIVDGVVSGQRSQFNPDAVGTGFIVVGTDPVAVDHVAARCMGFDPSRVRSLQAATKGALLLGFATPANVHVTYDGAGTFGEYFSARRRLEPESVQADWGDEMALRGFGLGAVKANVKAGRLVVTTAADAPTARLVAGDHFVPLVRSGAHSFEIPWSTDIAQRARLIVLDKHFNLAEKQLPT
jgi:uncharacterized protein (DUF362 family)